MAYGLEQFAGFIFFQLEQLGFGLRIEEYGLSRGDELAEFFLLSVVGKHCFIRIEDIEEGLSRHQVQIAHEGEVNLALLRCGEEGAIIFQNLLGFLGCFHLGGQILILARILFQARQGLFDGLEIRKNELGINYGDIVARVHFAIDVNDIVIREGAHYLANGVCLADIS